jgi:hypothetical protein
MGRAVWEACNSNLEFGNHLSICLKTEENQENLCRDGRSQDLSADAYWLLANSPANKNCRVRENLGQGIFFNFCLPDCWLVVSMHPEGPATGHLETGLYSKRTPHFNITKINLLMLFKEIIAVYIENYTKPTNTKCSITDCQSRWFI